MCKKKHKQVPRPGTLALPESTGCGLARTVGQWGEGQHLPPAAEETLPFCTHTPGPWVLGEMRCFEGQILKTFRDARASEGGCTLQTKGWSHVACQEPKHQCYSGSFFLTPREPFVETPSLPTAIPVGSCSGTHPIVHFNVLRASNCGDLERTKSSRSHSPYFSGARGTHGALG